MVSPMFFDKDKNPVHIKGIYDNASCFLTCGGPSLKSFNLTKLQQPGIITFGINNSVKVFRPNLWTCVDDPANFMISIWKDPTITKFLPHPKSQPKRGKLWDNTKWDWSDKLVRDCPNVIYHFRNDHFQLEEWFYEDTINWGNNKKYGGSRSVMLQAIRIISLLGFRNVFLLGADFKMTLGEDNYSWDQDRTKQSVNNNNSTYRVLNERFKALRPIFEKENFFIFNCTVNSGLKAFPYMDYDSAIEFALKDFPDTLTEKAEGMYERKRIEREQEKK